MCITFWTTQHPQYLLILIANRDEYLARPTEPASFHSFHHETEWKAVSGIDSKGGGTWLGINRTGRIAVLTNITEEHVKRDTSRGTFISDFLVPAQPDSTMKEHLEGMEGGPWKDYSGFNLWLGSLHPRDGAKNLNEPKMAVVTNHGGGGKLAFRWLSQDEVEFNGLSNGIDGQTMHLWTKIDRGKDVFRAVIAKQHPSEEALTEDLFKVLQLRTHHPPSNREELRTTVEVDPIKISIGAGLNGWYGTRLSTIVLVRKDGSVVFRERDIWTLNATGEPVRGDDRNDRVLEFKLALDS